jgi:hypothetical protein
VPQPSSLLEWPTPVERPKIKIRLSQPESRCQVLREREVIMT